MKDILKFALKVLIGLTFFVPLIVMPENFIFPFIVPKVLAFRSLVLLSLGIVLLVSFSSWVKQEKKMSWMHWGVLLYFVSLAISTFVGADWYRSFWDNHERMLGLFTLVHYGLYYFILSTFFTKKDWEWFFRIFLGAGTIVMILAAMQKINPEFLLNNNAHRVSATLGNAIYLSGYGLFLFAIGLMRTFQEKVSFWRVVSAIVSVLGFLGIFFGGTRGTLVGLVLGVIAFGIFYAIEQKVWQQKKARNIAAVLIVSFMLLIGGVIQFKESTIVQSIPGVNRLVSTDLTALSTNTRVMAWGVAVDGWKDHMLFGWGPNNYYYAFNKYYRAEFLEHGWGETWFDNAHSVLFNTLTTQGSFGVLVYFALFIIPIVLLWREKEVPVYVRGILIAFLVAHFGHNLSVFENVTSFIYLFFILAYVHVLTCKVPFKEIDETKDLSMLSVLFVGLFLLIVLYGTNIAPAKANMKTLEALRIAGVDVKVSVELLHEALALKSPHTDDIRNDFVRTISGQIRTAYQKKDIETAKVLYDLAVRELENNVALHPLDIRVQISLIQLGELGAVIYQDQSHLFKSVEYCKEVLALSPKRQQVQYVCSSMYLTVRQDDEAVRLLQEAVDNDSSIEESWWRLAATLQQLGQEDKAKEVIQRALAEGVVFKSQIGVQVVTDILGSGEVDNSNNVE